MAAQVIYSSGVVESELGLLAKFKLRWNQLDRKKKRILIGAVVIVVVILVLSVRGEGKKQMQPVGSPTPSPWAMVSTNVNDWRVYESDEGFSFKYPEGGTVLEGESGELIFGLGGPKQGGNTEFSDGIYIRFWVKNFEGGDLKAVVDDQYRYYDEKATSEVISKPAQIELGGKSGWVFSFESLGENRLYFFPLNELQYVMILDSSKDTSRVGLEEIDKLLLSTLSL